MPLTGEPPYAGVGHLEHWGDGRTKPRGEAFACQWGELRHAMGMIMSSLGWAILLVGLALSADVAWSEYREWRARRDAIKRGRTLTTKFGLPWV